MKSDVNGCSETARDQEQYEEFYSVASRGYRVQYDYRTPDGRLFSCIARTVQEALRRRDEWLSKPKES